MTVTSFRTSRLTWRRRKPRAWCANRDIAAGRSRRLRRQPGRQAERPHEATCSRREPATTRPPAHQGHGRSGSVETRSCANLRTRYRHERAATLRSARRPEPAMPERRQALSDPSDLREIELGDGHADPVGRASHDPSPGVDNHAVAVVPALAAGRTPRSPLSGRDDEGLIFDRPRAKEHVPVVLPRLEPERCGHEHDRRTADDELTEELREPNVVADREPDAAEFGIR